jgi:hypothetical protein
MPESKKSSKFFGTCAKGSRAYTAWVFVRVGGEPLLRQAGPRRHAPGLVQFHAIKHRWTLRNVCVQ